jgi:hypothetical protein
MAACFNSRKVAGQHKKEHRSEGRKLYEFSLEIGKRTKLSGQERSTFEKLDQLTISVPIIRVRFPTRLAETSVSICPAV